MLRSKYSSSSRKVVIKKKLVEVAHTAYELGSLMILQWAMYRIQLNLDFYEYIIIKLYFRLTKLVYML